MKDSLIKIYNDASSLYDETPPHFFNYFGEELVSKTDIKPGSKILDLACGKGAVSLNIARKKPFTDISAIDLSDGMLNRLAKSVEKLNLQNIQVKKMDAESLEFDNDEFDYLFCGFGLFIFSDILKVIKEIYRVLRPDGIFAFSTFKGFEDYQMLHSLFAKYFDTNEGPNKKSANEIEFHKEEGIRSFLSLQKFKNIMIYSEKKQFLYENFDEWWLKQWSHGMREDLLILQQKKRINSFKQEAYNLLEKAKSDEGYRLTIDVYYNYAQKA
jgi:ubiquinone/menaquinone biosynthesis C-methylase UbiE